MSILVRSVPIRFGLCSCLSGDASDPEYYVRAEISDQGNGCPVAIGSAIGRLGESRYLVKISTISRNEELYFRKNKALSSTRFSGTCFEQNRQSVEF